ncbi:TIGR02186 family protein [Rhizobium sp. L1K21]|uniref:TIGR02186 family protein n=1 Tax=Rhizobium sp. L1K21 TaxID=2954933 RepID=UPI003593D951
MRICSPIVATTFFLSAGSVFGAEPLSGPPVNVTSLQETIDIGVSTNEIAIASNFSGADITVFGAIGNTDPLLQEIGQYDIVVTLEGPTEDITVHKKRRVFGIWINTESMRFLDVPTSFSMASTRAESSALVPLQYGDIEANVDSINLRKVRFGGGSVDVDAFREALRRQKINSGLYQERPGSIRFISGNLFRATLRLPADVPNGVHTLHAYLFKSGQFVTQRNLPLRVVKTGAEQAVTDAAMNHSFFYGAFVVLLAGITGWLASIIFRRD